MYSQGDILLISIPFTDLSSNKKRPVLVISKNEYNHATKDIVVFAITSVVDGKPYSIPFCNDDMVDGVLNVDSCIRVDKIYTLSQSIVVKRFGKINPAIVFKAKEQFEKLIDLT